MEKQWRTVWSRAIFPTRGLCCLLQNKNFLSGAHRQQWGRVRPASKQWPSPTCPVYRVEALFVASGQWATLNLLHKTHRAIVRWEWNGHLEDQLCTGQWVDNLSQAYPVDAASLMGIPSGRAWGTAGDTFICFKWVGKQEREAGGDGLLKVFGFSSGEKRNWEGCVVACFLCFWKSHQLLVLPLLPPMRQAHTDPFHKG